MRPSRGIAVIAILVAAWGGGCATVPIDSARRHFEANDLERAEQDLAAIPADRDQIMHLMERGMIRHLLGDYADSTADWLHAVRLEDQFETHSASKAGASMLVNDTVLDFRGYPYERVYLHVFLARNYLAQGLWDDAAVEARNIIRRLEQRDGFPDDPYSRYVAGLCLELTGDSGYELQYRTASALLEGQARVDAATGRLLPAGTNAPPPARPASPELVCLIDLDGGPGWTPDSAEIRVGDRVLGATHTLTVLSRLEWESSQRMAARRMTKQVARIAVKESIAAAVEYQNKDLGELLRVLLLAMEAPDERHWRTLPRKLAVVRCPCPADLKRFDVVFRNSAGAALRRLTVTAPLTRRDRVFVSMCRDTPGAGR